MFYTCPHCNRRSMRAAHPECVAIELEGKKAAVRRATRDCVVTSRDPARLAAFFEASGLSSQEAEEASMLGVWDGVCVILEDGKVTQEEATRASNTMNALPQLHTPRGAQLLDAALDRLRAAIARQELIAGNREPIGVPGGLVLGKDDVPVWQKAGVVHLVEKTKRSGRGTSSGFSVRVAKGLTYRIGQFDIEPVETSSMVEQSRGTLLLTTKALYVVGAKTTKVPWSKIVRLQAARDGVEFQREGGAPEAITGVDGWSVATVAGELLGE